MLATATLTARAITLAGIVMTVGACAFTYSVLPRWSTDGEEDEPRYERMAILAGATAAAAVAVVAPLRLYLQARSLVFVGDPVFPMMRNVLHTTWGRGWSLQLAASLAAFGAFLLAARRVRGAWLLVASTTLFVALSPALMGHAVAAERFVALSIASDWLHVTAAGAWVGALSLVTIIIVTMRRRAAEMSSAASLIAAFHPVALVSAAALVASGVASLFIRVEHLGDLLHSTYGAVLAVKLALTLGVAALGWHHFRNGERLASDGGTSIARSLTAEAILAALVIGATAVLVGTAPPMPAMPGMNM